MLPVKTDMELIRAPVGSGVLDISDRHRHYGMYLVSLPEHNAR